MTDKLKLIHLANFNSTNIGNGALIFGLENVISEDFKRKIDWIREPWDDYTFGFKYFNEKFVDFVNQNNGLIINGAVTIHGRKYLQETGMRFELPLKLMEKIQKPVIFYGISYRHFRGQEFFHADTLKNTFRFCIQSPNVLMGVRNDGTKKWLEKTLKLDKETIGQIFEIPDTGIFTSAKPEYYPEILEDRKIIIFSPNDEDAAFRFANDNVLNVTETGYQLPQDSVPKPEDKSWIKNRDRLIGQLKNTLTRIVRETGGQLLLVPHYLDDFKFVASLVDQFEPQIAHQCSISTGLMRVQGTEFFYGRYMLADLAISMRVHSMSPCIGLGVPMIPLITQPRMWDFLKNCGLEDIGVDAFSEDLEQELFKTSRQILSNPQQRIERFSQAWETMRTKVRLLNQNIENKFFNN